MTPDYHTLRLEPDHYSGGHSVRLTRNPHHWRPIATLLGGPHAGTSYGPDDLVPSRGDGEFCWLLDRARSVVAGAARLARIINVHPLLRAFLED